MVRPGSAPFLPGQEIIPSGYCGRQLRAKKLQELLGDRHDSVVARAVLRDLAGQARAAGEDTFTYGVMHERQACQAAEIERTLPQFAGRAKK